MGMFINHLQGKNSPTYSNITFMLLANIYTLYTYAILCLYLSYFIWNLEPGALPFTAEKLPMGSRSSQDDRSTKLDDAYGRVRHSWLATHLSQHQLKWHLFSSKKKLLGFESCKTFFLRKTIQHTCVWIYFCRNHIERISMGDLQDVGPFFLNQTLKWSWHHPAGRFHTLTWGTAIDHQMCRGEIERKKGAFNSVGVLFKKVSDTLQQANMTLENGCFRK